MKLTTKNKTKSQINKCHICSKKFRISFLLREHIRGIHEKKFKCEKCGKYFTMKTSLRNHIRMKYCEKTKTISNLYYQRLQKTDCKLCNKTFASWYYLKTHEQLTHGKEGKYQKRKTIKNRCSICSKDFKNLYAKNRHLRIKHNYDTKLGFLGYEGGYPLICFHCNHQFHSRAKKVLIKHLIDEHFTLLKPKFECKICYQRYHAKISLKRHIETIHAKNFKCEKCHKMFGSHRAKDEHVSKKACKKNLKLVKVVPFFMRGEFLVFYFLLYTYMFLCFHRFHFRWIF